MFHHGTPSAARARPAVWTPPPSAGLRVRGLRRVRATARSTPRPDHGTTATVADDAADTAAVLDALGLGDFVTPGLVRRRPAGAGLRGPAAGALPRPRRRWPGVAPDGVDG